MLSVVATKEKEERNIKNHENILRPMTFHNKNSKLFQSTHFPKSIQNGVIWKNDVHYCHHILTNVLRRQGFLMNFVVE